MRRILMAGALLLVLIAAGVAYLLHSLDRLIEREIERHGSELTGTAVEVGGVDLRIAEGRGAIRGLRVANPEGFRAGDALALDDIELAIEARSPTARPFRIQELRVGETDLWLETSSGGRSNLEEIRQHAVRAGREGPSSEAEEAESGEPVRLAIAELRFDGGTVWFQTAESDEPDELELPAFALRDVGGTAGATGSEIGALVIRELVRRAAMTGAGHELNRVLEEELGEAGRAAGELLRDLFE